MLCAGLAQGPAFLAKTRPLGNQPLAEGGADIIQFFKQLSAA